MIKYYICAVINHESNFYAIFSTYGYANEYLKFTAADAAWILVLEALTSASVRSVLKLQTALASGASHGSKQDQI